VIAARPVKLRVANVAWMEDYHGREARLVGEVVDAVELITDSAVAYVDDRDGEVSELVEAAANEIAAGVRGGRFHSQLQEHAARRFLHGTVVGVRAA
jgi:hypothetical protein